MVRTALSLAVLLLAGATLLADNQKKTTKDATATGDQQVVVVDPLDLRQPVPNPEKELTEKYDSHQVRYTGRLNAVHQDKKTKVYSYDLQTTIRNNKSQGKTDKKANGKQDTQAKPEVVTVTVYLQKDDQRLRSPNAQFKVTVEGRGEITSDGSLIIRNAQVVSLEEKAKK